MLDDPGVLFSSLLIGTVGFGVFIYGKKSANTPALLIGLALSVVPMVSHSLMVLWGAGGAGMLALYASRGGGA